MMKQVVTLELSYDAKRGIGQAKVSVDGKIIGDKTEKPSPEDIGEFKRQVIEFITSKDEEKKS